MAREASATMPAALTKQTAQFMTSSAAAGAVPVAVTTIAEGVIQMMWLARLKPLAAVVAALILVTAGVAVHGRQQPAPERKPEQVKTAAPQVAGVGAAAEPAMAANRAIAREQLALIDKALAALHKRAQNAQISFSEPSFSLWGRRLLETLSKAGAGKAEIVAALEKYFNSLKEAEAMAKARLQLAQGSQVEVYDVQFRRMQAEIWLNEEKAR